MPVKQGFRLKVLRRSIALSLPISLIAGLSSPSAAHGQAPGKPVLCVVLPASNPDDPLRLNQLLRGALTQLKLDTVTITALESCPSATTPVLDGIDLQVQGDDLMITASMRPLADGRLIGRCESCGERLKKALSHQAAMDEVVHAVGLILNQAVADWRWTPLAIFKVRTCRGNSLAIQAEVEQLPLLGRATATAPDVKAYYRVGKEEKLQGELMWNLLAFFLTSGIPVSTRSGFQADLAYFSKHVPNEKDRFSRLCNDPGNHLLLFPYYYVDRLLINREQAGPRTVKPPGYIAAGLPKYMGSTKNLKEGRRQP